MHIALFDIDGTILRTGGAGMLAFKQAFMDEFGVSEITGEISFAGRSDRAIVSELFAAYDVEPSAENWQKFCRSYLKHIKLQLPISEGEILPGVEKLLHLLIDRGDVAIGLLTGNIRAAAEQKLGHYGLWSPFNFGGFGDEHPDRNDIAAAALASANEFLERQYSANGNTLERFQGEVIVIGDTPNDIRCGRSIGAKVVAVATGQTLQQTLAEHEPDVALESLANPASVIRLLDQAI